MHWNYRIFREADGSYSLREVYYDAEGKVTLIVEPSPFVSSDYEGPEGIIRSLELALAGAKNPVITEEGNKCS